MRFFATAPRSCAALCATRVKHPDHHQPQQHTYESRLKMQTLPEMYTPKLGGSYDLTPPGLLLLASHTYYFLKRENSQERLDSARQTMQRILAAARTAGYGAISQLSAALARGDSSNRVIAMAHKACAKVPVDTMAAIVADAKFY